MTAVFDDLESGVRHFVCQIDRILHRHNAVAVAAQDQSIVLIWPTRFSKSKPVAAVSCAI